MATGYIGKSQTQGVIIAGAQNGSTLSYTCPASEVRYAVLTVVGSVSIAGSGNGGHYQARAGNITCSTLSATAALSPNSNTGQYSIILGPGQTWSDNTQLIGSSPAENVIGFAYLEASVLEIV